jgi:hypothetical protein
MNVVMFSVADKKNEPYAIALRNSLRKFHTEEQIKFVLYDQAALDRIEDPQKFYRATPYFAEKLFNEGFDMVIKADADQIITGSLDYILDDKKYFDVGVVYNWNRVDPQKYGEIGFATIHPFEYVNCGFVVIKNKELVRHWLRLCYSNHFDRMPFREQGFLNTLVYYGNYSVLFLDKYDPIFNYSAWHGLVSKGEWNKIKLVDNKFIVPKGTDGFPEMEKEIKVIHWAGGNDSPKMNYRLYFQEDVIKRLDYLTNE